MTRRALGGDRTAVSESNTATPTAAPGEALIPVGDRRPRALGVEVGEHQLGELVAR